MKRLAPSLHFPMTCCWLPVMVFFGLLSRLNGQASCVQLRFSAETADAGDTVSLRLSAEGFDDISSYQFATRWNPADLQFLQYSTAASSLTYQLFNAAQAGQGKLISIWSDINATGVTLPDKAVLFEIKFKVLASATGFYPVWIDPDAPPVFELVQDVKTMPFVHIVGGVRVGMASDLTIGSCCPLSPPCNAPLGSVNTALNGGVEPYQYQWEGPAGYTSAEKSPKNLSPGRYLLTVTDATGAVARASVEVLSSYTNIQVMAQNTKHAVCGQPNGCVELGVYGGAAPYSYQWSDAGTAVEDRCDLTPGYHYVTVTDAFGCTGSGYVNVANDTLLSIVLDSVNADCRFNQLGAVHVTANGAEPYVYHWSNGAGGPGISELNPGRYSVTVSDAAGCEARGSATVKDYGTFDWFTGIAPYCPTAAAPAKLRLTGYDFAHRAEFPVLIRWSNGTVQELGSVDDNSVYPLLSELNGLDAGYYAATVTDADGCSVIAETSLNCVVHEPVGDPGTRFYVKGHPWGSLDSCASITVDHFSNIKELRFSLRWYPTTMELKNIKNMSPIMGISMSNFTVSSPGWVDFQWASPLPQGYSYPYEFPLFEVCFKNGGLNTPLLDFAYRDGPPKVVHATEGEKGFIGRNGRVYFDYGSDDEVVQNFNLTSPACAFDGYARVQLESYDNKVVDPYKILHFEKAYSYYPEVDADTLLFAPPGTFHVRTTGTNSSMSRFLVHIPPYELPSSECVWPGDADNNGVVNHFDLLYLGLGNGASGTARLDSATVWSGSDCADWPEQTPLHHLNFKNFDADGNGMIQLSDTAVIIKHWGKSIHPYGRDIFAMPGKPDMIEDQLSVVLQADTLAGGKTAEIPVALDGVISGLHGLAFSISYDPEMLFSGIRFESADSWFGHPGIDMVQIQRDFRGQRRLDIAIARTDGAGASGTGQIGKLVLVPKTPYADSALLRTPVFVSHALALTSDDHQIALKDSRNDLWLCAGASVHASGLQASENNIRLSPNPATGFIRIESPFAPVRRVEIGTVAGMLVRVIEPAAFTGQLEIPLENLPFSTYTARIFTENAVVLKKFVIAR